MPELSSHEILYWLWSMTAERDDKAPWRALEAEVIRGLSLAETEDRALALLERVPEVIDRLRDVASDWHQMICSATTADPGTILRYRANRYRTSAIIAKLIERRERRADAAHDFLDTHPIGMPGSRRHL